MVPVRRQSPVPWMQQVYVEFFVQPRTFVYCENTPQVCLDQHHDENVAILITDLQAVTLANSWAERVHTFDDDWAILLPSTQTPAQAWQGYNSIAEIAASSLPALI